MRYAPPAPRTTPDGTERRNITVARASAVPPIETSSGISIHSRSTNVAIIRPPTNAN